MRIVKAENTEVEIATTDVEWAVEYDNETYGTRCIIPCDDGESEARRFAEVLANSRLVCRQVFVGAWAEVAK